LRNVTNGVHLYTVESSLHSSFSTAISLSPVCDPKLVDHLHDLTQRLTDLLWRSYE